MGLWMRRVCERIEESLMGEGVESIGGDIELNERDFVG